MRDELTILCDELGKCDKVLCKKNKIVCAKKILKEYIGNDKNEILRLKAQIKIHDDETNFFSQLSTLISVVSLCLVIIDKVAKERTVYFEYALFGLSIIFLVVAIYSFFAKKTNARKSWKRYIQVALEELEKEFM